MHDVPELRRAGWGIVQVDDVGHVVARVYGPVWAPLPQTSQAAEFCAYAVATELINGPSILYDDCSNVVAAASQGLDRALGWRRPHAGIMKWTLKQPGLKLIQEVCKVKAHMDESTIDDPVLRRMAIGNGFADEAAKLGAWEHPVLARGDTSVGAYIRKLRQIAITIAHTCMLWPRSSVTNGKLVRARSSLRPAYAALRAARAYQPPRHQVHVSHYDLRVGDLTFCGICGLRSPAALSKPCRRRVGSVRAKRQLEHMMLGRDPTAGGSIVVWRDSGDLVQ